MEKGVMVKKITEEMGIHKAWYAEAREMTADKLPEFIRRLSHDYEHDYGTICHAIAAAAVGAAWAVERSPHGGITGFQGGAIMWEFMRHWNHVEGPARLLTYDDLLYPQYAHKFTAITEDTWKYIQKKAKEQIAEKNGNDSIHPDVLAHWRSVADGNVPFGLQVERG